MSDKYFRHSNDFWPGNDPERKEEFDARPDPRRLYWVTRKVSPPVLLPAYSKPSDVYVQVGVKNDY